MTYDMTRFNALKHGVLSRQAVLPHESKEDFESLKDQFFKDYCPITVTESTLVEELALIVWRKKRLLTAENAKINSQLNKFFNSYAIGNINKAIRSASPGNIYWSGNEPLEHIGNLLFLTEQQVEERIRMVRDAAKILTEVLTDLENDSVLTFSQAFERLPEFIQEEFDRKESYEESCEGLLNFIDDHGIPMVAQYEDLLNHLGEIRSQLLGEAINNERYESLARYEAHLDRKFERTVALLIKLQAMRSMALPNNGKNSVERNELKLPQ